MLLAARLPPYCRHAPLVPPSGLSGSCYSYWLWLDRIHDITITTAGSESFNVDSQNNSVGTSTALMLVLRWTVRFCIISIVLAVTSADLDRKTEAENHVTPSKKNPWWDGTRQQNCPCIQYHTERFRVL